MQKSLKTIVKLLHDEGASPAKLSAISGCGYLNR
jgi:hypothetical protein